MKTKLLFYIHFILLGMLLFSSKYAVAQCNTAGFTLIQTNGTCASNGEIKIQVPGASTCSNWIAVLSKVDNTILSTIDIPSNGGPVLFSGLTAGSYNVKLQNGSTVVQYPNNPVVITTTYQPMNILSSSTPPTCNTATAEYVPNGQLTINVDSGGLPPFYYSVTTSLGTQTFGPTANRTHVFGNMPSGEQVNFSVTDNYGTAGCPVTRSQSPIIASSEASPYLRFDINYRVLFQRDCTNCTSGSPARVTVSELVVVAPTQAIKDHVLLPGNATVSVNGGPEQNLRNVPNAISTLLFFDYPPGAVNGDELVFKFVGPCGTISKTVPVVISDVLLEAFPSSLLDSNCSPLYSVNLRALTQSELSSTLHFCKSTNVTIDYFNPATSAWQNVINNTPAPTDNVLFASYNLPRAGDYRCTVTDGCHTVSTTFSVLPVVNNLSLIPISEANSFLEGTSSIKIGEPINPAVLSDQQNWPLTVTIKPIPFVSSATINATGPLQMAGSYTVNFPVVKTYDLIYSSTRNRVIGDLPLGAYEVVITDNCGNSTTQTITLTRPATYNPSLTVISGCTNSNILKYNMNAVNVSNRADVRLYTNNGSGGFGTLIATNYASPLSGQFNNIPTGDYIVEFSNLSLESPGYTGQYSAAQNRNAPFEDSTPLVSYSKLVTIEPYQDFTATFTSSFCDIYDPNSGYIYSTINSNAGISSLTYQLYNDTVPLGAPIATTVVTDETQITNLFSGLRQGNYILKITSPCYSVSYNVNLQSTQVVPVPSASDLVICAGGNTTVALSSNSVEGLFGVTWLNSAGAEIGTGLQIFVTPTTTQTYTAKYAYNTNICPLGNTFVSTVTVTVIPEPNLTTTASDIELCNNPGPYTTTISDSQVEYNYEILDQNGNSFVPALTAVGNGGDLVIEIPVANLPLSNANYTVKMSGVLDTSCNTILVDPISFTIGTPDKTLAVNSNSPICAGTDAVITVEASENGATYEILQNGNPLTPIISGIGTGADLELTIPASQLNGLSTYSIKASRIGCQNAILDETVNIIIYPRITQVGATSTICSSDGLSYQLRIEVAGSAPFSVTGTGAPGNWSGNVWTSNAIATGTSYSATISDINVCNNLVLSGVAPVCCVFEVACPTFPTTTIQCYANLPSQTVYTEAEFEALGNGNGVIGNIPCGVIVITASNGASPACEGSIIRTYTITEYEDANNNDIRDIGENTILNTQTCTQTFILEREDFAMPANSASTVQCLSGVITPTIPVVRDNCGNVLTASAPVISASPSCEGDVTYTYTFTDCEGNTHDWVYTYTIDDVTPPTATTPASINLQCIAEIPVADINAVTDASDNCNGPVVVTVSDANNGGAGCVSSPYIVTRTYTLTDCSGLSTNLVQTITVIDTTVPVFVETLPQDAIFSCDAQIPAAVVLTATDNCSTAPVVFDEQIINAGCIGNYDIIRTWTATDSCGNQTVHVQNIVVEDNTAPAFVEALPQDGLAECDKLPIAPLLTAVDNCGIATVTYTEDEKDGECSFKKIVTRTWTATDDCGNATVHTQILNVSCPVVVYNALTPDGDGVNDVFLIDGIDCYPKNNVEIFNRWGVKVYGVNGYNNNDKAFKGFSEGRATVSSDSQLPTGTYFYVLNYEYSLDGINVRTIEKSGYLYINSK